MIIKIILILQFSQTHTKRVGATKVARPETNNKQENTRYKPEHQPKKQHLRRPRTPTTSQKQTLTKKSRRQQSKKPNHEEIKPATKERPHLYTTTN